MSQKELFAPPLIAHTFWHGEIGAKQLFSLKSFICTQQIDCFEIWLWMDGDEFFNKALQNEELNRLNQLIGGKIKLKNWKLKEEIVNTPFMSIKWYFRWDRILVALADDFRIIALYKYGGLYFDLDVMFVKDFHPLLMRDEFVYAWENQPFANNALIYLRQGSCLSNQIAKEMIKCKSSQPWRIFKYSNKSLSALMVYPCAMFDPLWLGHEEWMPIKEFADFFREFSDDFVKNDNIQSFRDFFPSIYAYHWHNQWKHEEFEHSYFGLFNHEFDCLLSKMKDQQS